MQTIGEVVMAVLAFAGIVQALGRGWEGWTGSEGGSDSDGGSGHHGG